MSTRASQILTCIIAVLLIQGCGKKGIVLPSDPLSQAYDHESDWNDAQHVIKLDFEEAQGKRVFYTYCVWCHADSTPAGPSNRSNVNPSPPLMNDGVTLNSLKDQDLLNMITLGGAAVGKSAMMPPYGQTLSASEIRGVLAYTRAIAQPAYHHPDRPGLP
jgi:cytochrome c5